jgi:hypothetical protein
MSANTVPRSSSVSASDPNRTTDRSSQPNRSVLPVPATTSAIEYRPNAAGENTRVKTVSAARLRTAGTIAARE